MKLTSNIVVSVAIILCAVVAANAASPSYKWSFADPNGGQLVAYETGGGVLTVASVHITNGCQTPFFVPERMPFLYDLKIRTATGPILCTHIVRDELVAFYEAGKTGVVRIKTASGTVAKAVLKPPTTPPLP